MKTEAGAIPVQMQDVTRTELARMERQIKDKGSAAYISDQLQRASKDDVLSRTLPLLYPRDVEDDPIIARLLENDYTRIA